MLHLSLTKGIELIQQRRLLKQVLFLQGRKINTWANHMDQIEIVCDFNNNNNNKFY